MNNLAHAPMTGGTEKASDVDIAKARLGESIEKAINLSHHLMDRLESVLRPPQPETGGGEAAARANGETPLSFALHDMASNLNQANDRICNILDRLGV